MKSWKDDFVCNPSKDSNYCLRQWVKFTALTINEQEKLKEIVRCLEVKE